MSETEHEPERELEALQDQADALGDQVAELREDWEGKKLDPGVPGAEGDPLAAEAEDPEATAYPAKGSSDSLGEDIDPSDPANEDL